MKRIGIICLIPMVLVILISILLYIPPFQNFAVRLATEYASETTGMNIGIADTSFLPTESDGPGRESHNSSRHVIVTRKFPSQHPSAATAEKEVLVDAIDLRGVKANTGNLIEGMEIKGT